MDKHQCQLAAAIEGSPLWTTCACALSARRSGATWVEWLSGSELLASVALQCASGEKLQCFGQSLLRRPRLGAVQKVRGASSPFAFLKIFWRSEQRDRVVWVLCFKCTPKIWRTLLRWCLTNWSHADTKIIDAFFSPFFCIAKTPTCLNALNRCHVIGWLAICPIKQLEL